MNRHRMGLLAFLIGVSLVVASSTRMLAQTPPPGEPQEIPEEEPAETPPEAQPPQPAAAPTPIAGSISLGDFAVRVAQALKLPAPPTGFTPESAVPAIQTRGVTLRPELSSPLTEADAVALLNALGYKIRTQTPSRVVSGERAEILIETFLNDLK